MFNHPELLRIPGPTPIPPQVQQAMNEVMFGHRSEDAKNLLQEIRDSLPKIFGTTEEVIVLSGSGTSALEAAVVNSVSEGDEVLVVVSGAFGKRFAQICEIFNLRVHYLTYEWGEAVQLDDVAKMLKKYPNIKAVFTTYCETSTSVLHPIREISELIQQKSDALMIVDGVSAVGAVETKMDEWNIDILISGSQKAFMLPPGLSFVALSKKAQRQIKTNKQPHFYLDVLKHKTALESSSTPYTPALSLLMGLRQVLVMFKEEGLENIYKRHLLMKDMVRSALRALHIPLLVTDDKYASPTVTAARIPNDQADELRSILQEQFGLIFAGGQQKLKGEIIRIGHMGYCTPAHILQLLSLLEIGLKKIGYDITLGSGVAAAQDVYISGGW